MNDADTISTRKGDHVRLAAGEAGARRGQPGFDDVQLVHRALPEVDHDAIDLGIDILGRQLALPLLISAMTGGYAEGGRINATLARAAERHGIAMGVGSQRAALRDPSLAATYAVARTEAPTALLMANVGAAQLVEQNGSPPLGVDDLRRLAEMIRADALVVHLNAVQELVMPEGDRNARGWTDAIGRVANGLSIPVVVKETGGGLSEEVARTLAGIGVAALDVGGRGGTSFAAIEGERARERGDARGVALADELDSWGIPTVASVVFAARAGLPVIATGGVRSGLDAARAIGLGARAVGVARPLLQAALAGDAAVDAWIERFSSGLRGALFLTGSARIGDLAQRPVVVSGEPRRWLDAFPEPRPTSP